jgi:hypothetical protein
MRSRTLLASLRALERLAEPRDLVGEIVSAARFFLCATRLFLCATRFFFCATHRGIARLDELVDHALEAVDQLVDEQEGSIAVVEPHAAPLHGELENEIQAFTFGADDPAFAWVRINVEDRQYVGAEARVPRIVRDQLR